MMLYVLVVMLPPFTQWSSTCRTCPKPEDVSSGLCQPTDRAGELED